MQAGEEVESAIGRHLGEVDETMLDLLQRRMKAAGQLERSDEMVNTLGALWRR